MFNLSIQEILLLAAVPAIMGYASVFIYGQFLKSKRRKVSIAQRQQILKSAQKQAKHFSLQEIEQTSDKHLEEELREELEEKRESIKNSEEDIELRQQFINDEEKRLASIEAEMDTLAKKVEVLATKQNQKQELVQRDKASLQEKLETKAQTDATNLKRLLIDQKIEARQLNCQKRLKELLSRLDGDSKRQAHRILSRCLSRYSPNFYWPKMVNHIELNKKQLDTFSREDHPVLGYLREIAEIDFEVATSENPKIPDILKLSGGMGLKREAARLTLVSLIKKPEQQWNKVDEYYDRLHKQLMNQSLELGRRAVMNLKLKDIHPEIQRMVGFLNWRTSYRQNQYLHTFEVAKFAGIIAPELGVDPDQAKRCGLMHDIGKSIDYRIEGGHAVISGDYADRYGESQLICDTVMSHHDELIVETPLAFVLKTADTLSGARPGARVNLEEGYQMRLSGINDAIRSFNGIMKIEIMNGAREVHVEVDHKKISDDQLDGLSAEIARKIEQDVAYPGQIKVLLSRRFEATATA